MTSTTITRAAPTEAISPKYSKGPVISTGPVGTVVIDLRQPSMSDRYRVRIPADTSIFYGYEGTIPLGFVEDLPLWETWLPELDVQMLLIDSPIRSEVGRQIEEVQRITGLSDAQLAAAFPGSPARETLNRWRNRPRPNLRAENLYRLGILLDLAREIERVGIDAPVWLHQPLAGGIQSPYELICAGQLGDVRRAVDAVAVGATSTTAPMSAPTITRDWDVTDEADTQSDDDDDLIWQEPDEDGDE